MKIVSWLQERRIRQIGTVVHVGAHHGQELESYLALRPSQILWIEADPQIFAELNGRMLKNVRLPKTKLLWLNVAVGDVDGSMMPFYRFNNNGQSSSFFRGTDLLRERWKRILLSETGESLTLLIRRLDSIFLSIDFKIKGRGVLVLDIQGSELAALRGLGEFLKEFEFIEVEVSTESIYEGAPLFAEIDQFLQTRGFTKSSEVPWHGDVVYSRTSKSLKNYYR